jgi:D-hexose-6-phosphate mutarotase
VIGSHLVSLELEDNESTRKVFPPFRALYTVELAESGALNLTFNVEAKVCFFSSCLRLKNCTNKKQKQESDLSFTMALHSYFSADISQTKVNQGHQVFMVWLILLRQRCLVWRMCLFRTIWMA